MGNFYGALILGVVLLIAGMSFFAGYTVNDSSSYVRCAHDCTRMFTELCPAQNKTSEVMLFELSTLKGTSGSQEAIDD